MLIQPPHTLLQARKRLLDNNGFAHGSGNSDRARPFSNPAFQQLIAQIHGVNQEIRAPVIAFFAYKLRMLLGDTSWNVVGQKIDTKADPSDADDHPAPGYLEFLDLAIEHRDVQIASAGVSGQPATWIRISHDIQVRVTNP